MPRSEHCWTEVDLAALGDNVDALRQALSPSADIIFVVKSDAYGHGMPAVAEHARRCGVKRFAVAHLSEALALRERLPDADIIMLGALPAEHVADAVQADLVAMVVSGRHAGELSASLAGCDRCLRCHAMVDTGMGRLGLAWDEAPSTLAGIRSLPGLKLEGLCSHFASADGDDRRFADEQASRMSTVVGQCREAGHDPGFVHMANSGAVLCDAAWDMCAVRVGILLYGYGRCGSRGPGECRVATRPFLQWRTRVLQVKQVPAGFPVSYDSTYVASAPTRIATIDVGYADGYSRRLSGRGEVIIRGRRHPVAGRVTMNLVTVDVGASAPVEEGDVVTLMGEDGAESIWADELAGWTGTIPYEVLTGIRAARIEC